MNNNAKSGTPSPRPTRERIVSPSRLAAFEILRRVDEEESYATVLLAELDDSLRADDRALCYEIVLGVLRWRLWLDALIEHFSGRKQAKLDPAILWALRIGLYQLRFLSRIPHSAVVNEAVNLAYLYRLRSAAGFINAVLRRATREMEYDPSAFVADPVERISIATSHPRWLVERWVRQFGIDEAEAFAAANNQAAPVAFRIGYRQRPEHVLGELEHAGASLVPSTVVEGAWRIEGAGRALRAMAQSGRIYVQDESSQLVARLLEAEPGERVLDACAAPGSKTTLIAQLTDDKAFILAGDIHEHRLQLVRQAARRQGLTGINCVAFDAEGAMPIRPASFERVLVDVPCSGTGTLRRNPEIRWRITSSSITAVSGKQQRILENAARMVKPGGRLVYSTCSVENEENEEVIARFLASASGFSLISPAIPPELVSTEGYVRIWPHRKGSDGFFAAVLARKD